MEKFYEKIFLFFLNFKNSEKGVKHFNDLITILQITITKFKAWKSTMSKLYLLTLLHEIISSIKQYLLHFDTHRVVLSRNEFKTMNFDILALIEEENEFSHPEDKNYANFMDRESNILNYNPQPPQLNRLNSIQPRGDTQRQSIENEPNTFIWTNLPDNLVIIFEIIVNLSVEEEPIVRKIHKILFEIFKSVIWELNLFSIIKMNKLLVTKCQILMTYDRKVGQKSVRLMIITLDCFHEFVVILNKKLDQTRTRDGDENSNLVITDVTGETVEIKEVLRMFEGIIDFILKGLYGHSSKVTEKIYILLKEVLDIEQGMEELVSISLFESIKDQLNEKLIFKTYDILENMFNLIHPLTFMKIIILYSHKKLFGARETKQKYIVEKLLFVTTNIMTKKLDVQFDDVSRDIFLDSEASSLKWIELWSKDPISFLKICLFNFKFSLAWKIVEYEVNAIGKKQSQKAYLVRKASSMILLKNMSMSASFSGDSLNNSPELKRQPMSLTFPRIARQTEVKKENCMKDLQIFLEKLDELYSLIKSERFMSRLSLVLNQDMKKRMIFFVGGLVMLRKNNMTSNRELKKLLMLQTDVFSCNILRKTMKRSKVVNSISEEKLFVLYKKSREEMYMENHRMDRTPIIRRRKMSGGFLKMKIQSDKKTDDSRKGSSDSIAKFS